MKKLTFLALVMLLMNSINAQDKSAITDKNTQITWLGLDFSQLKFIGSAAQWSDLGEISSDELVQKYFPAWNALFINEQEKYNVADATKRAEVKYAIAVTDKANAKLTKGKFFSDDPDDLSRLTEANIANLVSKYNFQGEKGLGMMMFVEGMSKSAKVASIWITYVNMNTKKVLLTKNVRAEAGGIGFRNYWASTFKNALKENKKSVSKW